MDLRKELPKVFSRVQILKEIFSCDEPKLLRWELCDKIFKRKIISGIFFYEDIGTAEDKLYFWKIMQQARNFAYIPLFKYHYRMCAGAAIHGGFNPKVFSSLLAERRIWNMCQKEDNDLKELIICNYMSRLLIITCQMLIYDSKRYESDIRANQKELRCNFSKVPLTTWRRFFGMVLLCLPFKVCCKLILFVKRGNH